MKRRIWEYVRERLGGVSTCVPTSMSDLVGDIDHEAGDIDTVVYGA